jgi:hypothetical protein
VEIVKSGCSSQAYERVHWIEKPAHVQSGVNKGMLSSINKKQVASQQQPWKKSLKTGSCVSELCKITFSSESSVAKETSNNTDLSSLCGCSDMNASHTKIGDTARTSLQYLRFDDNSSTRGQRRAKGNAKLKLLNAFLK